MGSSTRPGDKLGLIPRHTVICDAKLWPELHGYFSPARRDEPDPFASYELVRPEGIGRDVRATDVPGGSGRHVLP